MSPITSSLAGDRLSAPAFRYLSPAALAVAGLHFGACRWPLGELTSETFRFCSAGVPRGKSYCPAHAALAGARALRAEACAVGVVS